jgi:hypothetical protein
MAHSTITIIDLTVRGEIVVQIISPLGGNL